MMRSGTLLKALKNNYSKGNFKLEKGAFLQLIIYFYAENVPRSQTLWLDDLPKTCHL